MRNLNLNSSKIIFLKFQIILAKSSYKAEKDPWWVASQLDIEEDDDIQISQILYPDYCL